MLKISDESDELILINNLNGIKLIRKDETGHSQQPTIKDLLQQPFSAYFLNTDSQTQIINDEGASICGFDSAQDAQGKTLFDISPKKTASLLIKNCLDVIQSHQTHIFEESYVRKDDTNLQFLSVKTPWYNHKNEIIGLMGCSIALGKHSLSDSLNRLKALGLLNQEQRNQPPKTPKQQFLINNTQISQREYQCLELTIKGLTAKMIARKLNISHRTVEDYLSSLKIKVGARSKSELVQLTVDNFYK